MTKISRILNFQERKKLLLLLLVILVEAGLETFSIGLVFPLIHAMSSPPGSELDLFQWLPFGKDDIPAIVNDAYLLCLLAIFIFFLKGIYIAIAAYWKSRFCYDIQKSLSRRLFTSILSRDYLFFLSRNSSELAKNIITDISNVNTGILFHGVGIISEMLVTICILLVIAAINPGFFVPLALTICAIAVFFNFILKKMVRRYAKEANLGYGQMLKTTLESFHGVKEIKLYRKESLFLRKFEKELNRYCDASSANQTLVQLPRPVLEVITITVLLAFVAHYYRQNGSIEPILPLLGAYVAAGFRLLPSLNRMISSLGNIRIHLPSWRIVQAAMEEPDFRHPFFLSDGNLEKANSIALKESLELKNISYTYPGTEISALQNISLKLPARGLFGIAGYSGSGKSTLIDILLGLLSPTAGEILIDRTSIQNLALWQALLAYVPQQIFLTDDSIANNVAFGESAEGINRAKVKSALANASLQAYIEALPLGIDTEIGERGGRMSGGQRQRIGIARALYHDPKVLLLDEATSALDSVTEHQITATMQDLSRDRLVIVVAHRLSTLKNCEKILVLDKGLTVGYGSFSDLNGNCPIFRDLVANYMIRLE